MFGSFLPSLWSLSNQSLLGSRGSALLCNQVAHSARALLRIRAVQKLGLRARKRLRFRSGSGYGWANLKRGFEDRTDGKHAAQPVRADGSQTHGREATTGLTVRASAELAGSDLRSKIRRNGLGSLRENTILRAAG